MPIANNQAERTVVVCGDLFGHRQIFNSSFSKSVGLTVVQCLEDRELLLSICQRVEPSIIIVRQALLDQLKRPEFLKLTDYGRGPHLLVIVVEDDDAKESARMLRLGCHGVLAERRSSKIVRRAVSAVLGGELWAPRRLISTVFSELLRVAFNKDANGLTPQEHRILELAEQGLQNSAIATALFISTETVRWHKRRLYRKIGRVSRLKVQSVAPSPKRATVAS